MKDYKVKVTLTEMNLPLFIKKFKNYNPTLDFKKEYLITQKQFEDFKIKSNKDWSSINAIIKMMALQMAFNDGLKCHGNLVNYKIS